MISANRVSTTNAPPPSSADAEVVDDTAVTGRTALSAISSGTIKTTDSISTLNQEIRDLEQNGESSSGQIDALREQRDELIKDFTGNPSAESYDVDVVGWAQSRGTTYNYEAGQLNKSRMFQNAHRPADSQIPYVNMVRELPWESQTINNRVDSLISQDGLSTDAAIVVAMTDRPTGSGFSEFSGSLGGTPIEAGWEENFASRVTKSADEIGTWATNQPASATATFGDGGVDIKVSMRGDQVVVSDGVTEQVFNPADHDRIVIVGGNGDDSITVDDAVIANLTLVGGAGDDTIFGGNGSNIIIGGDGNDNLEGGASGDLIIGGEGRDSVYAGGGSDIVSGGDDSDALYGGSGKDLIIGEGGDDYMDGGRGNDVLRGGVGNDTISGGSGLDILHGEGGRDTLIGASGQDRYADAFFGDTVIAEAAETVSGFGVNVQRVEVDNSAGSDAVSIDLSSRDNFTDRVNDDLQTMRSLNSGQEMLNALDDEFDRAGHTTVIEEFNVENGRASSLGGDVWLQADGTRSDGESATIEYNPHYNTSPNATPKVPIAVLFHELAHTYDYASGQLPRGTYTPTDTTDPNFDTPLSELQAAGIRIDHDDDPSTPDQLVNEAGHPFELTENGLREELGLPSRAVY